MTGATSPAATQAPNLEGGRLRGGDVQLVERRWLDGYGSPPGH